MKATGYTEYKSTGIKSLPTIPAHWQTTRFRFLVSASNAGEVIDRSYWHSGDQLLFSCQRESMLSDFAEFPSWKRTSSQDLLVTRNGTPYVHVPPPDAIYSNVVQRCTLRNDVNRDFVSIALESACERLRGDGYGVSIPSFSYEKWCSLTLSVPPPAEQRAIADFLDRETARLDTLVGKKRELIEKLKEKRTALISRTVTRGLSAEAAAKAGLNPNPKLKPSGIELLGDIPVHWDVKPLRYVATRIQTGSTPPTAQEKYYENGSVPWFGPGSFGDAIVLAQPVKLLNVDAINDGAARLFRKGATFVVTIGATLGKVSSIDEDASCNQQITVAEVKAPDAHPRFITYQLKRLEETLRAVAPSATLPILSQDEIARLLLALPPAEEQRAIPDYLDRETAKIDKMIEKVEAAIEKLQEYRTALITAAVTGKIDVRNGRT